VPEGNETGGETPPLRRRKGVARIERPRNPGAAFPHFAPLNAGYGLAERQTEGARPAHRDHVPESNETGGETPPLRLHNGGETPPLRRTPRRFAALPPKSEGSLRGMGESAAGQ